MTGLPNWLPELIEMNDFGGDWDSYLEALYSHFKADFIDTMPYYQGLPVQVNHRKYSETDLEAGFWHMTSRNPNYGDHTEENRICEPERCKRIRWVRKIIERADGDEVKVWTEFHKGERRHLWAE